MPELIIKIKDKIAKPLNNCVICDNSDYTVKFIFDEEWEKEPLKIARFIWNKQYVDVQFTGDTCEVPIISKTNNLAIGVYAGDLRTTTPAILTCYTSILSEDVIEHSVTPSEYEEIMKLLNAQATDIAALKATDKRIWTNLDTINKTASAAKLKAEEGVAKADDALTKASSNTTNINSLQTDVNSLTTDVNALKATDKSIWTNLDTINKTASAAKLKAEEGVAKADDALTATRTNATNISTHETRLDSIDNTLSSHDTRITTAQQKANSVDEKVDSTNEVVGQLSTSLQSAYNKINAHANDIAINRTTLGTQCKNLLKNTAVTKTVNGVTFTVNNDKSITVSGTATNRIIFLVGTVYISKTRNYTYTGTPSGGASSTYSMNYRNSNVYKTVETGNGITTQFERGKTYEAVIDIRSGVTISNLTFYPMLRDANITDDTYEPYKENIDERLIQNKSDIAMNKSTLGTQCKNLLNETEYLSSITSVSIGTFNISGNSITLTATGKDCYTKPHTSSDGGYRIPVEPDTDYILSWESNNTYAGLVYVFMNGNLNQQKLANNKDTKYIKFTTNSDTTFITIRLGVATSGNSITYSNIMLRYADILDDTYEPYQPSLIDRCLLKDTAGINLGHTQNSSITIDNLSAYTVLWVNVAGNVSGINFQTNLIVPVAYLAKSTSNRVQLAGGIPSSAYIASGGPVAAKDMNGYITAKVNGNTLDLTISDGTIGGIEVISLM